MSMRHHQSGIACFDRKIIIHLNNALTVVQRLYIVVCVLVELLLFINVCHFTYIHVCIICIYV